MQKEFTKSDLKDGMVAEYRDGDRRLVIDKYLIGKNAHYELSTYNENLEDGYPRLTIMKVFKIRQRAILERILDDDNLELIWERKEPKKMTVEEMRKKLEELTGEKIEHEPSKGEMMGTCYEFCKKQDCSSNCILYRIGSCAFKNYTDEQLKQCYEKVMEDV